VTRTKSEAAAAVSIGAGLALRRRDELLGLLRPCFARTEPWLQAGKYVAALASELPRVNGWSIARRGGDRTPDRTQRLLNHAIWDTFAAMGVVRRFAVAGLEDAARRGKRRGGLVVGAIDETGQEKAGQATAGVKRQYLGCAGKVANGINTVHLAYVREGTGHALIGARQWVPREQIEDPVKSLVMGLPLDLAFRTKGQLAIDLSTDAAADGIRPDFYCGDETSDAVKLSSCPGDFLGGGGEGGGFVVVVAGDQAVVQAAEQAAEQVALGGGVPVAGVAAAVVVGAGAG
jgi:DDE superfamily endonuclease